MRFKDFEITIRGDFDDGDSEKDFRKAIAKKLGGLTDNQDRVDDEATVKKIDDGEARWSPPLQQHLDVVKQSLGNARNLGEVSSQVVDIDSAKKYYEKFHEHAINNNHLLENQTTDQVTMCGNCGRLLIAETVKRRLGSFGYQKIQEAWNRMLKVHKTPASNPHYQCSNCSR